MALVRANFDWRHHALSPFPAPLCEACNTPMKLNGEYTPTEHGKLVIQREYQCSLCGKGMKVRRTFSESDA
jgi:hypothetical protein